MGINLRRLIRSTLLLLVPAIALNAQTTSNQSTQEQVATVVNSSATAATANMPAFADYRGVKIGMSAEEVRAKLDGLKKGDDHNSGAKPEPRAQPILEFQVERRG